MPNFVRAVILALGRVKLRRQEELDESPAEFNEIRAPGFELPQDAREVICSVAVAFAAEAVPPVLGCFVHVQAGCAVLVEGAADLARAADRLAGEHADIQRWVERSDRILPASRDSRVAAPRVS